MFPILRLYECIPQTWNVLPIGLLCIQNVEMGFFERPYFVQTDNRRKKAQKLFRFKDFDLVAVMFFCCKKNSYENFTFHFFRSFNPKKGSYTKKLVRKKAFVLFH